ncbi:MAG: SRPBCC family protein [Chloroflexota bacterium]
MGERVIPASAPLVYSRLADYRNHHPNFLPPEFSDFEVESGGLGAGTQFAVTFTIMGRSQADRMRVDEPEHGRVLRERSLSTDLTTTFTVEPRGDSCQVTIETTWTRGWLRGLLERWLAVPAIRKIYARELVLLEEYVTGDGAEG